MSTFAQGRTNYLGVDEPQPRVLVVVVAASLRWLLWHQESVELVVGDKDQPDGAVLAVVDEGAGGEVEGVLLPVAPGLQGLHGGEALGVGVAGLQHSDGQHWNREGERKG